MNMTLRRKIFILIAALVTVNLAGAGVTVWYTFRTQTLYTNMVDNDLAALEAAQGLQSALVSQKGYVTYFFLNSDSTWLDKLALQHQAFEKYLRAARNSVFTDKARDILNDIESEYLRYVFGRERVIGLYKEGRRKEGEQLHWDIRDQFLHIMELCAKYKQIYEENISEARYLYERRARIMSAMTWVAVPLSVTTAFLLAFVLLRQVLNPIRRLAVDTGSDGSSASPVTDEVEALSGKVKGLIEDVDSVRTKLDKSRANLVQHEKMAQVGKLAASVAHSIRNPLTSVKMRLFSLERALNLEASQKEDFEVVSQEIGQIDGIVRNFLEYARRPKLKVRLVSPSEVMDTALQLLAPRIEAYDAVIVLNREQALPEVAADPEQLKEVMVNLIINALEAMGPGGSITITEEMGFVEPHGKVAVLRVADSGPGIAPQDLDKVFEPFYSSKEEGSGLGLNIAKKIMEEHGGWLHCHATEGQGAVFVLGLPCERRADWLRS
ncbi:MAG: ATP-binding protein [Desulfovibrionaceae bacterium]